MIQATAQIQIQVALRCRPMEDEIVLTPDGSSDTVTCVLTNMDFDCQKTNAEVTVPIEG